MLEALQCDGASSFEAFLTPITKVFTFLSDAGINDGVSVIHYTVFHIVFNPSHLAHSPLRGGHVVGGNPTVEALPQGLETIMLCEPA